MITKYERFIDDRIITAINIRVDKYAWVPVRVQMQAVIDRVSLTRECIDLQLRADIGKQILSS